jgi:hypothetical protein
LARRAVLRYSSSAAKTGNVLLPLAERTESKVKLLSSPSQTAAKHKFMEEMQAIRYLESLIGQTLRVHTTDTRMFVGTFKCTDAVSAPWPCHDPVSRS